MVKLWCDINAVRRISWRGRSPLISHLVEDRRLLWQIIFEKGVCDVV